MLQLNNSKKQVTTDGNAIEFINSNFHWKSNNQKDKNSDKKEDLLKEEQNSEKNDINFQLKDMNFSIKKNSLNVIIGTVGSGKTSLIQSILGIF